MGKAQKFFAWIELLFKTHNPRHCVLKRRGVDGMFKTQEELRGQPHGVTHPVQNLDVTKPHLPVEVATALPEGVLKHRIFRLRDNLPRMTASCG